MVQAANSIQVEIQKMRIHLNDDIGKAFEKFCTENGTTPEKAIETLVNLFGWAQIGWRGLRKGAVDREKAIIYMDNITANATKLCDYGMVPMAYPLFNKLQLDLIKCLTCPGYRSEPYGKVAK
jgi:hypothetical protein